VLLNNGCYTDEVGRNLTAVFTLRGQIKNIIDELNGNSGQIGNFVMAHARTRDDSSKVPYKSNDIIKAS